MTLISPVKHFSNILENFITLEKFLVEKFLKNFQARSPFRNFYTDFLVLVKYKCCGV